MWLGLFLEFETDAEFTLLAIANRSSCSEVFCTKSALKILQNSQKKTCAQVSFCNLIKKETQAQVFSCEFCTIFKNTYFYRTPLVAASKPTNGLLVRFVDFNSKHTWSNNVKSLYNDSE